MKRKWIIYKSKYYVAVKSIICSGREFCKDGNFDVYT